MTEKTKTKSALLKQIGKFASVGVLNTLLDLGVLNFLILVVGFTTTLTILGFDIVIANLISVSIAIVNSYFLNRYWTFGAKPKINVVEQFGVFVALSIVGMIINTIVFSLLFKNWTVLGEFVFSIVELLSLDGIFSHDFTLLNFAKIMGTVVALSWNFISYKKWAFKS